MPSITSAAAWPVQAPFFLVLAAAVLYHLGGRRSVPGHREDAERRWRSVAFYGGLLTVVVATDTPLDPLSDTLFSAHMAQHILLLMVAPGLIVLAAPWLRLWQPLPLGFVMRQLGLLECQQDATADAGRILDALEAGCERRHGKPPFGIQRGHPHHRSFRRARLRCPAWAASPP